MAGNVYDSELTARLFFFQAEDGIRDLVRSRGLGDVYKRQLAVHAARGAASAHAAGPFKHDGGASAGGELAGQGLSLIHI